MSDINVYEIETKPNIEFVERRPDLSAKLERLKRGLVSDTIPLGAKQFPSLRDSQINFSQKSGRFGAFDPLRKRSKMFRRAVTRFAPPYYFWHKELVNSMKLKPLMDADPIIAPEVLEDLTTEIVSCIWCHKSVGRAEYEFHKTKRCKRRYDHMGNGYYQCTSCGEGFLDEVVARDHVALHFPNLGFASRKEDDEQEEDEEEVQIISQQMSQKNNPSIICRDQAKRRKWL